VTRKAARGGAGGKPTSARSRGGARIGRGTRLLAWSAAIAVAIFAAVEIIGIPGVPVRGREVRVFIRRGAPFREAAESLAAQGVIRSARAFGRYASLRSADRSLRWGTYVLLDGMAWEQILGAMRAGRGVVHTVTIPEGWTIAQISAELVESLDLTPDSISAAVRDTALLHRLNVPTPTVEGYLFPATYTFPDRISARDAVRLMVERFETAWKPAWDSILSMRKMTRHDVVTLASIVEREVRKGEERPVVAAVYTNRLRIRMPLQADPTIDYALGRQTGRVLYKDLRVDSPYNTYRNPGLPPGPIGAPGAASLEAALFPAKVPYLYFVAAPDGHHEFRRTYAEHLAAIRMVRKAAAPDSTVARSPR